MLWPKHLTAGNNAYIVQRTGNQGLGAKIIRSSLVRNELFLMHWQFMVSTLLWTKLHLQTYLTNKVLTYSEWKKGRISVHFSSHKSQQFSSIPHPLFLSPSIFSTSLFSIPYMFIQPSFLWFFFFNAKISRISSEGRKHFYQPMSDFTLNLFSFFSYLLYLVSPLNFTIVLCF